MGKAVHIAKEFKDQEGNDIGGGGGGVQGLDYESQRLYGPGTLDSGTVGTTSFSMRNGELGASPIIIRKSVTIDALELRIRGGFGGPTTGKARFGAWLESTTSPDKPGAKIADSGEVTLSALAAEIKQFLVAIPDTVLPDSPVFFGGLLESVTAVTQVAAQGLFLTDMIISLGFEATHQSLSLSGEAQGFGFLDTTDTGRSTAVALPDPFPLAGLIIQNGFNGRGLIPLFRVK